MSSGKFIYKGIHRRFQYQPRYYDSQKETMDHRRDEIRSELGLEERIYSSKIGFGMFSKARSKKKEKLNTVVSTRFLSIIVLLCAPVAWIFYGEAALWICGVLLAIPLLIQFKSYFN
jgi:hypothetical protein